MTTETVPAEAERPQRLFGRRRGRRLRESQGLLYEQALPRYRLGLDTLQMGRPHDLFPVPVSAVWLEIGFGGGEHLSEQAARNPEVGFIGADIYQNGIVALLAQIEARNQQNIRIVSEDARRLLRLLPDASIERIFVLFPDPWPKSRHHKRRLIDMATVTEFARVLADFGELRLATDDLEYLRVMLATACAHPQFEWQARRPHDWRQRPHDWPQTRYEAKAITAGRQPAFLRLLRRPRA